MVHPLVPGTVDNGNPGDCNLTQVSGDVGLGADGAEEGVPAVCYGGRMQEGEVEGLEGTGCATGGDSGHDGGFGLGGGGWRVGGVGETHFGMGRGGEGLFCCW